jgi:hypothetical protein
MSVLAPSQIGCRFVRIVLSTMRAMISGMAAETRVATSDPPSAMMTRRRCRQQ